MKSKKYPNLYKPSWSPNWVFRKYSSAKRSEFSASTGLPATTANEARAYKIGHAKFDHWLGIHMAHGRQPLVRDFSRAVLAGKANLAWETRRKAKYEIETHINPALGHLRPDQVTSLTLSKFEFEQRSKGRRSLFNAHKILMEILGRARDEGVIRVVPKWKLSDPAPQPPRFIDAQTFGKIRRLCKGQDKLLLFILYHQGARPKEVLRYRWEMIRADDTISIPGEITKTGRARTIPLNSRVARALRPIRKTSGPLFVSRVTGESKVNYDLEWRKAVKELGLDFTVYNLRDSFITRKLSEGVPAMTIARYVDNSAAMIERKYFVPLKEIMRKVAG